MTDNGYKKLIDDLVKIGYLKTPCIIKAFRRFERKYFVPESLQKYANENRPLPIGEDQTISQPLTVAFMLELLQPESGHKVLEIGGGSGWLTAILSDIVGDSGKIITFEIVDSLAEFGKQNLERFSLKNVEYQHKDFSKGYAKEAPYDRIISGASFKQIPMGLKKQLVAGGILVAPTQKDDIRKITRVTEDRFEEAIFPGFAFVPITGDG